MVDLDALSLSELRQLQTAIARAITDIEERKKADALARMREVAKGRGYSLADLITPALHVKHISVPQTYRHPQDEQITWSGRGRMPRWFMDAMTAGQTPDDLSVI